jgi:D-amino peptidase
MKVFISADIEGVTGITHWDEADRLKPEYSEFREQMTAEVSAACEGALQAGFTEIWVKDAHASARNLIAAKLPRETRLIRGWSGHPFSMVQELDASFDAMLMIGYHSRVG